MATVDQNSNAVLQGIARHVNCLSEENRNTRKRALEGIRKDTFGRKEQLEAEESQLIFNELLKPLLKELSDPVEKCRELSINLLQDFLRKAQTPEESLPYLIPVLVQRLGQQEIVETSEELRLMLVEMLTGIVERSGKKISLYVDDYVRILQRTIVDPFPDVKKESCKCASVLAKSVPEVFHMQSETLINPLLKSIAHQHSKVRTIVVETIGDVIQYGNGKSVDTVVSHLAQRLFDQAPTVRKAVTKVVGMKYERENEEEFKDKLNFAKEDPVHYPPNVERPNFGCRTLVMRHLSKILPGLMKDVCDWVVANRIKSAALLYVLLINAEDFTTQHMEKLLSGMYKACMDEETQVVKDIKRSAELIGYFVDPEVWTTMILSHLKSSQSYSAVMVLSCIVRGSQREKLKPYLQKICKEDVIEISQDLFNLLVTIMALKQEEHIYGKVNALLDKLCVIEKLNTKLELYTKHTKPLIDSFQESFIMWNTHSMERLIFDTLLVEAGPVIGDHLEDIIPVLVSSMKPSKDPEVRLKFFSLLSKLMMNCGNTLDSRLKFRDFAVTVVKDIIMPNCIWVAGKTAAAIRTTAVSCMWALLQSGVLTKEKITTCMDDSNKSTRLISCRVMTRIFDLMGTSISQDRLHNMYPELLKRLDDSSDEIRITVSKTFLAYLDCFEGGYDVELYRAHLEAIYKGLLVHLDDPDSNVLKKASEIQPDMLISEVETVKHKHRTPKYCEELIQHAKRLNITS
ncbi:hypothetical protein KUTeg_004481 [Tegillarca granosa]|uniref:Uncharacterized protein n=1 Tax=Tegillarca granosa TaxID=220873 RepID=A0ABQ9FSY0_TEGGR|nr:hypothetical protein KUTeg_004481 [Tegillarca granosa]